MQKSSLPILLLKDIILFPYNEIRLELETEEDKELISLAESVYGKYILLVYQNESYIEHFNINNENNYGVVGYINMKIELPNNKLRIVIRGIKRVEIENIYNLNGNYIADVKNINNRELSSAEEIAYTRTLIKRLEYFIENNPGMSNSVLSQIIGINDINRISDILLGEMPVSYERKLEYVKEIDPTNRVIMLLDDMSEELKIIALENSIEEKVSENLDKSQKEYLLNEKIKVINEELGINNKDTEINELIEKTDKLNANNKIKDRLHKEINRYEKISPSSPEITIVRNYIDSLLSLPWNNVTVDNKNLNKAKEILDGTHYGLEEVKERIIEHLAVEQFSHTEKAGVICLVGPPGVGKTTFAKSVAKALGRRFTKISVGGINDEAEIVGHRRTYIGSSYGKIIGGIKKAGSKNPVFVIDEIDKMTKDIKADPSSALLEVLDKTQNKYFVDNYIEEEFDLSNVLFICTANYKDQIPNELYDRMEIIDMNSYTLIDKLHIAKNYIIPRSLKEYKLTKEEIIFTDSSIIKIINNYTKEAGVRDLERMILSILRKIVKDIVLNKKIKLNIINEDDIKNFLGEEKYPSNKAKDKSYIGCVNALSYTLYGGDVLKIEATYYSGNSNILTTGSLGDVFKESALISYSYIKSNYDKFNIDYNRLIENDIHIHVPEGAIRKDGPSAGVVITTSIISALTETKIPDTISMTGEITLKGDILRVGGIKEKVISAKRFGIKKIFLPKDNEQDIEKLDKTIKRGIKFIYVSNYETLYEKLKKEINTNIE